MNANSESLETLDPCAIAPVVDLVFGRWTSHVLYTIAHERHVRFTDLQSRWPFISPKVLTERLRDLERNGLVRRLPFREMPRRVEYEATPLAESMVPLFRSLTEWAGAHLGEVQAAQREFDRKARASS